METGQRHITQEIISKNMINKKNQKQNSTNMILDNMLMWKPDKLYHNLYNITKEEMIKYTARYDKSKFEMPKLENEKDIKKI